MSHKHEGQRYDESQPLSLVHQLFYTCDYKGQVDKAVQPHGVHELHYHVSHKCVHKGKEEGCAASAPALLRKVQKEGHSRRTHFAELKDEYGFRHDRGGQQQGYYHKGACHIIGKHTHGLSAEISAPGIEQAAIPVKGVPEILVVVHILPVEIQHQYRLIPEGMHSEYSVGCKKHYSRQQKNSYVYTVFPEKASESSRLFGCLFTLGRALRGGTVRTGGFSARAFRKGWCVFGRGCCLCGRCSIFLWGRLPYIEIFSFHKGSLSLCYSLQKSIHNLVYHIPSTNARKIFVTAGPCTLQYKMSQRPGDLPPQRVYLLSKRSDIRIKMRVSDPDDHHT